MRTVFPRFLKTPRCSRNLLEAKFRANAPCGTPRGRGVLVSLSPAAVPGGPDTDNASKAVMVCASCPGALAPSMRHLHRAKRWRRLVAGSAAKRLPWCRAWRDFFESVTGSPQALSAAVTALLDAAMRRVDGRAVRRHPLRLRASCSGATGRHGSKSCGRRPHAPPPTCHAIARRATADWRLSSPRAHHLFFRFRMLAASKAVASRTRRSLRLWRGRGASGVAAGSHQMAFSHLAASDMSTAHANFNKWRIRSMASRLC